MKRVKGRARGTLPSICIDEHMHRDVASVFRQSFRTLEAARWNVVKGRDEREYIADLRSRNIIFVTSDLAFVQDIGASDRKHAGIVYLHNDLDLRRKVTFAGIASAYIEGGCHSSSRALHNCILYPAHDGVRLFRPKHGHELAISWPAIWGVDVHLPA